MLVNFTKMHGLGNDFVLLDLISSPIRVTPQLVRLVADRHFGIGCDQVLVLDGPAASEHDFSFRIFNPNGEEVEHCGNGARCLGKYIIDQGLSDKNPLAVESKSGTIILEHGLDGQITVNMGCPTFLPEAVPTTLKLDAKGASHIRINQNIRPVRVVGLGNPHCVFKAPRIDDLPVGRIGKSLQKHQAFPKGVNVGFMQIIARDQIKLRVFERGAGETLACGSNACAAVISGILQDELDTKVQVMLPGGTLWIEWPSTDGGVFLRGPASSVFRGQFVVAHDENFKERYVEHGR